MTRIILGIIVMITFSLISIGIYYLTVINPTLGTWILVIALVLFLAYAIGAALENEI